MRFCFIAPFVLALAACAAPEPQPAVVAAADPNAAPVELECHQESSMGSNLIHKVCTKKLTEEERIAQQEAIRNGLQNSSLNHQAPSAGK